MMATASGEVTILADDLTGACDTGTLFAGRASVPVTVWPRLPAPSPVRVLDTESRSTTREDAARRAAAAVAAAPARRCFKKIDSTLRGHVGPELSAVLHAAALPSAVLTPAFPAQGRTVVERVLRVDGIPVAETPLARDPDFPPGDAASVMSLLRPSVEAPLAWIPLAQVREGAGALAARLDRLRGTVAVADAETDADLDRLVAAALAVDPAPLLAGSAGLARALAARLGLLADRVALPAAPRWLIVAGSRHPATRRQIAAARAAGMPVLATADADLPDRAAAAAALAAEARALLDREVFDLVAVTGGQTAIALWHALGAERVDLVGAPGPGLAFGYLRTPRHPALALLTKAGGFGPPDLFVSLREGASRGSGSCRPSGAPAVPR